MKLSDAVVLGDGLKKCEPGMWLSKDGSCGCAFGGALLACGLSAQEYQAQIEKAMAAGEHENYRIVAELPFVKAVWPWLTPSHLSLISGLYYGVQFGTKTIYDVAAYCRSIEPADVQESATPCEQMETVNK